MPDKPMLYDLMAHVGYLLLRWGHLEARLAGAPTPAELDDVRRMRNDICHALVSASVDPTAGGEPELRCQSPSGRMVRYAWSDLDAAIRKLEGSAGRGSRPEVPQTLFTRQGLEADGFRGWVPFAEIPASNCPAAPGVYAVVCEDGEPQFAAASCGGWFKRQDPSVAAHILADNWVAGVPVLYLGKATDLKRRLRQYAAFGAGRPVAHWGGRLIWQLARPDALLVAWKETPGVSPDGVEAELLRRFRALHGKLPFANLRAGAP